jgi:hypothetical protein
MLRLSSRPDTTPKTDEEQNHADVTKIEVRLSNITETNAVPEKRSSDTEGPKRTHRAGLSRRSPSPTGPLLPIMARDFRLLR